MKKLVLSVLASAAILASGCGTSVNLIQPVPPANAQVTTVTQVEFLARPGIAEALLFENDLLNAYNSVTPRFQKAALDDPNSEAGQAAAPIFAQAIAVLTILEDLQAVDPPGSLTVNQIVGAFLPDVMRIDTTLDFKPLNNGTENQSYGTFNSDGTTISGGRKLTDDVVNTTLSVLTDGAVTSDGVPYYRPTNPDPGFDNEAIGHSPLQDEVIQFGDSTFPYLAAPQ
jgi:Domain of unknown function (DUF4331)